MYIGIWTIVGGARESAVALRTHISIYEVKKLHHQRLVKDFLTHLRTEGPGRLHNCGWFGRHPYESLNPTNPKAPHTVLKM